ncbi:hypothetical protein GT044_22665 [Streptomyces sp. SID335]|uniref:hypothetical protein n=1 Tax=unclassified Streptomyces TaxID=2593676 RepID=UPI00136EB6D9|nr:MULTISPECIES: hypothetical protein [unclassified Streptomyces]MYY84031.1 hypothetical protein [Streptomyces sp. SID335]NDZ87365.1 hypothetical protein [Streptomyces sp. SID10115]NEB49638.1 hypothetical protein [Streptomyces sp. SID339]
MTTSAYTSVRDPEAVAAGPLPDAGAPGRWRAHARLVACLLPALVIGFAGFQRRWMSDDGHIYVRTVRQVLAGNGPVFNAGERAESSTGTLWQWLLVAGGAVGADVATVAMYGGLLFTVAGFALAGVGAAVRPRGDGRGGRGLLVPCGALVLLALPPIWDFATSGLETGLATCWIAGAWLALVARPRSLVTCAVLGLGPLVRPDLALVSVVFLAAQWVRVRPSWRGALAGAGVAGTLPVAYEIFRMGYYGHLMPLPGVTKEASRSLWGRGFDYLWDFAGPYALWLPVAAVTTAVLYAGRSGVRRVRGPGGPGALRDTAPVVAPLLAGALCWLYVIKVGGDFMHGRMFLPGLLLMLLPVFLVPLTRVWGVAALVVGVWAVACAGALRVPYEGRIGAGGIADERGVYVRQNAAPHPLHHDFAGQPGNRAYGALVREAARSGAPTLLLAQTPVAGGAPGVTGVYNTLGFSGSVVPLSGAALDPIGLAYPLAAHSEGIVNGRVGHDKRLPDEWIVAERGAADVPEGLDPERVDAARRALRCGPLAELRAATRAPLTMGRFWRNLTGAMERTSFRFPNDPVRAERQLCGR